ncbi:gamma-glutamyl-gamma-aminobutyrate hydrolase family protein [Intrasporangium flavum]|uniref:gamma-glutamyl-gamma-aminobutyrate hydrolase family protein n=1 Tax=Intrasporangium flavum TaxID=1428657 RepID=UPI00096FC1CE|nr:gamma-glutamyl-gamma-aminobutyrate hydrolase family protein [Intrasporangium flavum]
MAELRPKVSATAGGAAPARPVVAVSAHEERVVRQGAREPSSVRLAGSRYVDALGRVGAVALLVPARDDLDDATARQLVASVDALVLTGGGDVAGHWFGEPDHPEIGPVDAARDVTELALARAALEAGLPVLGVCRGMQVMAVAAGGTVEQHLPDRLGHDDHRGGAGPDGLHRHEVATVAGSRARALLGPSFAARCHHHQGVGALGPFVASAWSADGVCELMELPADRSEGSAFAVGVQSHPETVPDDRLFAALVDAARSRDAGPSIRTGCFEDVSTALH